MSRVTPRFVTATVRRNVVTPTFVLLPFLFVISLAMPQARAAALCRPQHVATIDATDASGLLFAPAQFGALAARLLIDTGSDWNLMATRFAKKVGLTPKRLRRPYLDVAGGRIDRYVSVSQFGMGPLALSGDFVLVPESGDENYDATIGAKALSVFDVEIDGAAVTLYRPDDSCRTGSAIPAAGRWSAIAFSFDHEVPEINVLVSGKPLRAVLDTGASRSLMDIGAARRLFGLSVTSPGVSPYSVLTLASGKTVTLYAYTFPKLGLGDVNFDNVEILLGDFAVVPFTLGMREIKRLHIFIAFKRRIMYAAPIGRPN
jgi:predicted aspartyl protease